MEPLFQYCEIFHYLGHSEIVHITDIRFSTILCSTRVKTKLEQMPCEQFLQAFEFYRALLRVKQVGEKRDKIKKPVKIAHKAVVLIFFSL